MDKEVWLKQYKTTNLRVVEQTCRRNNLLLQINEDDSIDLQYVCTLLHPSRGGKYPTFTSSLLPAKRRFKNTVFFDDDSEITDDIVSELNEVLRDNSCKYPGKELIF